MKIITLTGYKGGVGKSTSAIHVAAFLSTLGKVILIDGDPNRTALAWAARGSLPFKVCDERQAVREIAGHDYAVIDTPARPDSTDLDEFSKGCDLLILPTSPDVVSLEPMMSTSRALKPDANYRALITLVPPPPNREGQLMRAELEAAGIPVFKSMIRRSVGFQRAALEGVPIRDLKDSRSRLAWRDYQALGKEVLEAINV